MMNLMIKSVPTCLKASVLIMMLAGSSTAHNSRIYLPQGMNLADVRKHVSSKHVAIAIDTDVFFVDTLSSRIADKGKEIVSDVEGAAKTVWEKTKEGAQKAREAVASAFSNKEDQKTEQKIKQEYEHAKERVHEGWEEAKSTAESIKNAVKDREEHIATSDKTEDYATVQPIVTKWPAPGMDVLVTRFAAAEHYPVYVAGSLPKSVLDNQERSETNKRLFSCVSGFCFTDHKRLEREFFLKLINATDAISLFNTHGQGKRYLVFISEDEQALRRARSYGLIGIKYEGMKRLIEDLAILGLPTPNRLYEFSS